MKYLIRFNESRDKTYSVGSFNDFIKKYSKTDYVSSNNIKKLNNSDIKYDYFKKLESDVSKCLDFISNNDIELLEDILIDVRDDFDFKINGHRFKIKFKDPYWRSTEMSIYIKKDEISETDKSDIIGNIINNISDSRDKLVKTTKYDIEDNLDSWSKYYRKTTLLSMSEQNPFNGINIKPSLTIDADLLFITELWNYPLEDRDEIIKNNSEQLSNFETTLKNCLNRYLDAIGFKNMSFTIHTSTYGIITIDFLIS